MYDSRGDKEPLGAHFYRHRANPVSAKGDRLCENVVSSIGGGYPGCANWTITMLCLQL